MADVLNLPENIIPIGMVVVGVKDEENKKWIGMMKARYIMIDGSKLFFFIYVTYEKCIYVQ